MEIPNIETGSLSMHRIPPETPEIIEGLVNVGGLSLLIGKPKTYKSTIARQMCIDVALGRPFAGRRVRPGNTLYINLESPTELVTRQLHLQGYPDEDHGQPYRFHSWTNFKIDGRKQGFDFLDRLLQSQPFQLIVIDPLVKLTCPVDNDSYPLISIDMADLRVLANKYNTHIMGVGHAKKKETDNISDMCIGSTAYTAGTDANIYLRQSRTDFAIASVVRWQPAMDWTRFTIDKDTLMFSFDKSIDEIEESRRSKRKRETRDRIERELLARLAAEPSQTQAKLLDSIEGNSFQKVSILKDMVTSGQVTEVEDGHCKRYYIQTETVPVEQERAA